MEWLTLITDPLAYPFMLRGFVAVVLVGIVCALVGTYVVLRGMAFFGDALAHSILPGIAVGYLISGPDGPLFWWGVGHRGDNFAGHRRHHQKYPCTRGYRNWDHFCRYVRLGNRPDLQHTQLCRRSGAFLVWGRTGCIDLRSGADRCTGGLGDFNYHLIL